MDITRAGRLEARMKGLMCQFANTNHNGRP